MILSNVCNAYCDLAYNLNRDELGGTVNLEKSFTLRLYDSYRSARYDVANNRTDYTGEGPYLLSGCRKSYITVDTLAYSISENQENLRVFLIIFVYWED